MISTVKTTERLITPPQMEALAVTAREEIITGVCTFGDCPVETTTAPPETVPETEPPTGPPTEPETEPPTAQERQTEPEMETITQEGPEEVEEPEEEPALQSDGYTVTCWVTAYCGCYSCSEGYGNMTATGRTARPNHTIAVDPSVIPYDTQVEINGITYTAEDCGGGVNGYEIDVYCAEHWQTEAWDTGYYTVTIY
jgi:3D (Asp-Asp-Asp) domain-containing protein